MRPFILRPGVATAAVIPGTVVAKPPGPKIETTIQAQVGIVAVCPL
jgi:hypothetical protein